jgi:TfoX/Sxy family transcriptional regulator of competence genes
MASDLEFVEFVADHLADDLRVSHRMMFGEYVLYGGGKVFALICDDRLFIKPTGEGRAFIGEPVEAPPYPGAKPCFLIEDRLEDTDWLSELARITVRALPEPKPKRKKKKGAKPKKKASPKAKASAPRKSSRGKVR